MYVLKVDAEICDHITFEVPNSKAVGQMIQILFMLGVNVKKVTVTFRDELPIVSEVTE